MTGGKGNDLLFLGTSPTDIDILLYSSGDGSDTVNEFITNDQFLFTGINNIDVVKVGFKTELRLGNGIAEDPNFGTGDLLATLFNFNNFTTNNLATGSSGTLFFN